MDGTGQLENAVNLAAEEVLRVIYGDDLFDQNIFSVVQELPYKVRLQDQQIFSFRPDLCFFVNGIYR